MRARWQEIKMQVEDARAVRSRESAFLEALDAAGEVARELDQRAGAILDSPQRAAKQLEAHGLSPGQRHAHRIRDCGPEVKAADQRRARDRRSGIADAREAVAPDNPEQAVRDHAAGCGQYDALLGTISEAHGDRTVPEKVFVGMVRQQESLARALDGQAAAILASGEAVALLGAHGLSQAELEGRRERESRMALERVADRQRQHHRRHARSRGMGWSI